MRRRRRPGVTGAVAVVAVAAMAMAGVPAQADGRDAQGSRAADDFRVNPYLQNPADDAMTVTWFTRTPEPGELRVTGPGIRGVDVHHSTPSLEPSLDYTEAELAEQIPGLEQGSWLRGGDNYKHTVELTDLRPDRRYRYEVRQGDSALRARFETAPDAEAWRRVRFVALSDSETEPQGRVQRREWAPGALARGGLDRPAAVEGGAWDEAFGTTVLSGVPVLRYMLTEDEGYAANLDVVEQRDPDFVMMPGDLVQGGGYQPGWDEFFRHNAGTVGSGLSTRPIVPALGNWENYGALNGGYGTPGDRSPVVRARDKYHAYFDTPSNGTPAHQDDYHRVDYGPVTVITLDSSNGEPDDEPDAYPPGNKLSGREYDGPGTDTQSNFTRAEYEAAGGEDLADLNPGSTQWEWAEAQLADARRDGQIVFVQFHHAPFSSGEHGLPMNHELTSGQGGTPMRQYHELFERHGVTAVLSGHSEMFERSIVDADGDGTGVVYYDVGVSGDGLRGEKRDGTSLTDPLLSYNSYSRWTADQHEPERWEAVDGTVQLVEGGKHYGHLEVNVERVRGRGASAAARVTLTPVYVFPVLNGDYELQRTERRVYGDEVVLTVGADGTVLP